MSRWQLIWLVVKVLCRLLFKRDISSVVDNFAPKSEPEAPAASKTASNMVYDVVKSRLVHGGRILPLLLLMAGLAYAGGSFTAYDGLTKLNKRITGGVGIDISAGGVLTATGSAVVEGSIPYTNISSAGNSAYLGKTQPANSANAYKGNSAPSATEFSRLAGVTAPIQGQISSAKFTAESKPDLSNVVPTMNGIGAAGTGPTAARVDHVHASDTSREPANANIQTHISSTSNPHSVTKSQVGLGNVDNTTDLNKPISTATQTALNLKANTSALGTVAFTNSYTSLIDKPATYTLPTASTTVKGGIKVDGTTIVMDGNGVASATVSAGVTDVNGQTGTVTVTPANIGAATLVAFTNYTSTDRPARSEVATAAQGANADTAKTNARKESTYTILPYGDTRLADYYCAATDCGAVFQTVYDTLKAAGKGGKIKALEGTYPFTTTVNASDADSIIVEGIAPAGMWGNGGTIFSLNANVEMFYFGRVSQTARANVFKNIHFKGNSRPYAMIYSVNGHNFEVDHNYFELCMPCIVAERPWDWRLSFNNYRSCGSGNTATTAAVVLANATVASDGGSVGDNGSGWHQQFDRFETRPGTSIFIQPSSSYTMNMVSLTGTKFEGIAGQAYPAVYGSLADSRLTLNSCYYADNSCFNIDSASYSNEITNNFFSASAGYDIMVSGDDNIVAENSFNYPVAGAIAHINVTSGADGTVVSNNHKPSADTVTLLVDNGTNTDLDSLVTLSDWPVGLTPTELGYVDGVTSPIQAQINSKAAASSIPGAATPSVAGLVTVSGTTTKAASVTGALTQGKQATFDLNGNLIASSYDTGATGGGAVNWGGIGGTLSNQTDLSSALAGKQATLISQTNIKSVNGASLLGSGDLTVGGMTYPGAGVPVSTGSAWGTSLDYGFGANKLLQLNSDGNVFLKATNGTNTQVDLQTRNGSGTVVSDWIIAATTTPQLTFYDVLNAHNTMVLTPGAPDNSLFVSSNGSVGLGTNSPTGQLEISKTGASSQLTATVWGGGTPTILGRYAVNNGQTSTAQAVSGSTLLLLAGQGWDDTPGWAAAASAAIAMKANQTFTSTARGGYLAFQTTADNTTSRTEKVRMHGSGCVSVGSTVDCGTGSLSVANMIVSGYEEKTASYTVSKDSSKITLASSTAVVTLPKTLPAGEVSVLVTVAGAAASGVSLAAESGGSLSWGDIGAPAFTNSKTADVVCISQNATATTTAAWRCAKGGNF